MKELREIDKELQAANKINQQPDSPGWPVQRPRIKRPKSNTRYGQIHVTLAFSGRRGRAEVHQRNARSSFLDGCFSAWYGCKILRLQ